ncbi:MAG: hypothetical protein JSW40_00525 [Candidatus Omnitrophota bacterium]|nr:MAG: hypothetical protein JSW40_00525 [Candidatus Omnitrophota bacterium]
MEESQTKMIRKKYKRPLTCLRLILIYLIFLFIAKNSSIYQTGIIPEDLFSIFIAVFLVAYRFLSIVFVPVLLVLWMGELSIKREVDT